MQRRLDEVSSRILSWRMATRETPLCAGTSLTPRKLHTTRIASYRIRLHIEKNALHAPPGDRSRARAHAHAPRALRGLQEEGRAVRPRRAPHRREEPRRAHQ